jgi:hypothetical protein
MRKRRLYSEFIFLVVALVLIPLLLAACSGGGAEDKPVLQYGEHEWRLNEVNFQDWEQSAGIEPGPGYVRLRANFESLSGEGLIQAWLMYKYQLNLEVAEAITTVEMYSKKLDYLDAAVTFGTSAALRFTGKTYIFIVFSLNVEKETQSQAMDAIGEKEKSDSLQISFSFIPPDIKHISIIKTQSDLFNNVYVTDNGGEKYPAIAMGESFITFAVPENSQGFTLYFLDAEPIALGK